MAMVGRAFPNGYGRAGLSEWLWPGGLDFFCYFFYQPVPKKSGEKNKQMLAQKCKSFANKTLNRMKSILNYSAKKKLK